MPQSAFQPHNLEVGGSIPSSATKIIIEVVMPQSAFQKAFEHTVGLEGGYSNNPNDRGGKTMFGITEAVARENGYMSDMSRMTIAIAQNIYYNRYWDKMQLNDICRMSEPLATELFDTGVNMGNAWAVMFLQKVLNAFNSQGKLYADVKEDGVMGRSTVQALHAFYAKRGIKGGIVLLKAVNGLQCARYLEISQARPANEDFVFGWISNRVGIPN